MDNKSPFNISPPGQDPERVVADLFARFWRKWVTLLILSFGLYFLIRQFAPQAVMSGRQPVTNQTIPRTSQAPVLPSPKQPKLSRTITQLPSSFINTNWQLPTSPSTDGYNEASIIIEPTLAGPTDGSLQYFALGSYSFSKGGKGFYGGLQTKISNNTTSNGKRGVIFTVWGTVDATPASGAAVAVDATRCDGETGASCVQLSLPYAWKNDTAYRFRYQIVTPPTGNTSLRAVRASITDLSTSIETVIGDISYAPEWGGLPAAYYTFDETFPGGNQQFCETFNPSDVIYRDLSADNGTVLASSWQQFSSDTSKSPCANLFHYDNLSDGYRIRLGIQ